MLKILWAHTKRGAAPTCASYTTAVMCPVAPFQSSSFLASLATLLQSLLLHVLLLQTTGVTSSSHTRHRHLQVCWHETWQPLLLLPLLLLLQALSVPLLLLLLLCEAASCLLLMLQIDAV